MRSGLGPPTLIINNEPFLQPRLMEAFSQSVPSSQKIPDLCRSDKGLMSTAVFKFASRSPILASAAGQKPG